MAIPLLELTGTWEEIKERIPDFAGSPRGDGERRSYGPAADTPILIHR